MQRVLAPARILLGHRGFMVVLGCNLLLGLAYSFISPFLSMFGTLEAKMSPVGFGVFMTVTSLSAILLSTVLARWSDTHWSRRRMLVLGSACGALGYVGYAFVRDVAWLTVIGSTVLAVSTITFSQLFAHARELLGRSSVPKSEAPLYMNVFRLFFALAWTIGPAAAAWVMVFHSYRGLFLTAALLFVLLLAMILRFIPETPPPGASESGARTPLRESLRRPDLLAYFAGFVLISASGTISMMNLPLLVLTTLHGTPRDVGIIYSLAPVFELPLMFWFGLLASRGDPSRIIRIGAIVAVVYYSSLLLVRAPWQIYPLQVLGAAMAAINSGIAITFFQNYLPGQAGTATNLYANALRFGSTAGYLLFGTLAATLGHRGVFAVCAALSATTLALFVRQHYWGRSTLAPAAPAVS